MSEAGFKQAQKNPAFAGFFEAAAAPLESGGLQGLDARGEAALVTGGLVLVDQAAGAEAIQDRLGGGEGSLGAGGVVGVQGLEDLLDGGTELRTLGSVAGIAHDGLLGALLGGLDVGHGSEFLENCYGNGVMGYSEREIMADSTTCVNLGGLAGEGAP